MAKQERKDKTPVKIIRIALIDDDSHKELFNLKASKGNAITILVTAVLAIMALTYCLFAFTGLRYAIPGYPTRKTQEMAVDNLMRIDSLENIVRTWDFQITNLRRIALGQEPLTADSLARESQARELDGLEIEALAKSDSLLREQVKQTELFNISAKNAKPSQIEGLHFYPPVKGIVTQEFNKLAGHPFIDVTAPENTSICSILDGTVISAEWNDKTGYTIQIQHDHNIVSVYKHNEKLLRKAGDKVSAGTPVAIIGNTGELSTGTHLHFELWHNGEAVNPALYITF
ncbi:MAG: M23 family metallopeptidase [Bacteroidales bacterium]|nr:M23 family metallopeptidase [Candidatus Cacconaster merdequi]